jgi:two-component system copper resistance phosphate regulon response regulator CusR
MRILLAEDDQPLRTSIARGLQEAAYEVEQAATGTAALTLAEAGSFDAIVLDVLLPGTSGVVVCRSIRARGDRVPILMLTALDAVEHRIAGLDAGADDYLTKPFDFGELLARLRALTRRSADALTPVLVVGDLVIDTERHTVRRGARTITLTGTEFAFLLLLARHAGKVVSRAELMEQVWEDHRNTYSNIIDVYASRLRRKNDEGEATPMFTTLRGTGFILQPQPAAAPAPENFVSGAGPAPAPRTTRRRNARPAE